MKERVESGFFLLEGVKAIEQVSSVKGSIDEILITRGMNIDGDRFGCPVREISSSQFLSISNARAPQGIIAVVKLPSETYSSGLPPEPGSKILLLENIQDPGNIGTLLRTAVAFGFSGALLSLQSADPFSPKAVQATAGTVLSLWIRRSDNYLQIASSLKQMGYSILSADVKGDSGIDFSRTEKMVVALGNEGSGLTAEILKLSEKKFRIPISSNAESLNVAVSGAIAMFCAKMGYGC
ncbi:MAG: RNA methyltransferase [Fibrobacter sp.]|jgi:TrmH family RNA methyltransferase|nr:RNA methyltransferase [Fibrobacter sp.]